MEYHKDKTYLGRFKRVVDRTWHVDTATRRKLIKPTHKQTFRRRLRVTYPFFGVSQKHRLKPTTIIGKPGMGKSTLLHNMMIQDMQRGDGLAFLDPHGETAHTLLAHVPEHRLKDVIYFNPSDLAHPIGLNLLEKVHPDHRHLVADSLLTTFKHYWDLRNAPQFEEILLNASMAMLEMPGGTLLGVKYLLSDARYRNHVIKQLKDEHIRKYWAYEFEAQMTKRDKVQKTQSTRNKLSQFLSAPGIRNIIGQSQSAINFRQLMNERKILIANLSVGANGEHHSNLFGAILCSNFYLAALARSTSDNTSPLSPFHLYIDEFHQFTSSIFEPLASGARKFGLSLTVAHQYLDQLPKPLQKALVGTDATRIAFRVGDEDAAKLCRGFTHIEPEELASLDEFRAHIRYPDGRSLSEKTAFMEPLAGRFRKHHRDEIITNSRRTYATPRAQVEKKIADFMSRHLTNEDVFNKLKARHS